MQTMKMVMLIILALSDEILLHAICKQIDGIVYLQFRTQIRSRFKHLVNDIPT